MTPRAWLARLLVTTFTLTGWASACDFANPPYGGPTSCPVELPQDGQPCELDPSQLCSLGSCNFGESYVATCMQQRWLIHRVSCVQVPAPCPSIIPLNGEACPASLVGSPTCVYGSCSEYTAVNATCIQLPGASSASAAPRWEVSPYLCGI